MAQKLWRQSQGRVPKGGSVSELVRVLEKSSGVDLTSTDRPQGGV
jgi:hypothetical protein